MNHIIAEMGKFLLRGLAYWLADILFWTICYWLGWFICKVITFGRYPDKRHQAHQNPPKKAGFWLALIGFFSLVFIIVILWSGLN
ncbi:hypothetical protein D0Y50_06325 [Salinimonas sediminis]|uniref:Uncharacterized protein n=1 Tax=Salinimonas sediminis TaxID=2303538 RepID=A0A346NKG7_9ALTE|nr:hypothetical protein D0Y50_06325 [Salinimonas sediminis]